MLRGVILSPSRQNKELQADRGIAKASFDGKSNYDAFQVEAKRRSGQVMFDGHWTWSNNTANYLNLENPYSHLQWNRVEFTARHRGVVNV